MPYPSCLQTTLVLLEYQRSSHTEPHKLFRQISTLPTYWFRPSTSLTSPSRQLVLVTAMTNRYIICMTYYIEIALLYLHLDIWPLHRHCENSCCVWCGCSPEGWIQYQCNENYNSLALLPDQNMPKRMQVILKKCTSNHHYIIVKYYSY